MVIQALPLVLLWNEGSPNPNNLVANSIYTKFQTACDTWATIGMQHETFGLVANYPGAYTAWTATNSVGALFSVFGDFMATELDAVGHEYGHGVFIPLAGAPPMAPWDMATELGATPVANPLSSRPIWSSEISTSSARTRSGSLISRTFAPGRVGCIWQS